MRIVLSDTSWLYHSLIPYHDRFLTSQTYIFILTAQWCGQHRDAGSYWTYCLWGLDQSTGVRRACGLSGCRHCLLLLRLLRKLGCLRRKKSTCYSPSISRAFQSYYSLWDDSRANDAAFSIRETSGSVHGALKDRCFGALVCFHLLSWVARSWHHGNYYSLCSHPRSSPCTGFLL